MLPSQPRESIKDIVPNDKFSRRLPANDSRINIIDGVADNVPRDGVIVGIIERGPIRIIVVWIKAGKMNMINEIPNKILRRAVALLICRYTDAVVTIM